MTTAKVTVMTTMACFISLRDRSAASSKLFVMAKF